MAITGAGCTRCVGHTNPAIDMISSKAIRAVANRIVEGAPVAGTLNHTGAVITVPMTVATRLTGQARFVHYAHASR